MTERDIFDKNEVRKAWREIMQNRSKPRHEKIHDGVCKIVTSSSGRGFSNMYESPPMSFEEAIDRADKIIINRVKRNFNPFMSPQTIAKLLNYEWRFDEVLGCYSAFGPMSAYSVDIYAVSPAEE